MQNQRQHQHVYETHAVWNVLQGSHHSMLASDCGVNSWERRMTWRIAASSSSGHACSNFANALRQALVTGVVSSCTFACTYTVGLHSPAASQVAVCAIFAPKSLGSSLTLE